MHYNQANSEPISTHVESETESLASEKPQKRASINLMDESAGLVGSSTTKPVKAAKRVRVVKKSFYQMCMRKVNNAVKKFEQRGKQKVLSINSPHKTNWDLIVMFLATYNCFQIPIEVAFDPVVLEQPILKGFGVFIDLMFFVDMIISFRTTYIDERTGQEVKDLKMLANYYLRNQFLIDFLATVPFDTFAELILGDAGFFKFLGALKLVRVMRLSKVITYLRSTEETKAILQLCKLVFYLIMYVHCFGCGWWLIVVRKSAWIPPYLYGSYEELHVYDMDNFSQYSACLHAAMLLMTGNDVGPRTSL